MIVPQRNAHPEIAAIDAELEQLERELSAAHTIHSQGGRPKTSAGHPEITKESAADWRKQVEDRRHQLIARQNELRARAQKNPQYPL